MKRKLFLALMAFLAIALVFTGCPDPNDKEEEKKPEDEFFTPPTDWVGFSDAEMLGANFYFDDGENDGTVVKNSDGTFDVTIKTRDTGNRSSVVWFTFEETVFRHGYYISMNLPTNATHRPVQVDIVPSSTDNGGSPDGWEASNNSEINGLPDEPPTFDASGYVIGDLNIHWGTEEAVTFNFITFSIWFTWDTDVVAGEDYTFTINTIKVKPHDTSIVDPDLEAWVPGWVSEPTGWTAFPLARITAPSAAFPGATITENTDGSYKVVTTVRGADGSGQNHLQFSLPTPDAFKDGLYVSMTLPTGLAEGANNIPARVVLLPEGQWGRARDVQQQGKWIEGQLDILYEHPEDTAFTNFVLEIYWHDKVADTALEFTINKVLFKESAEVVDPSDLESWTPDPITAPTGWLNFPGNESLAVGTYPAGGSITSNGDGTYTVTAPTRSDGKTQVWFHGDDFLYKNGFYLSVNLPDNSASTNKPRSIYAYAGTSKNVDGGLSWPTEQTVEPPADHYVAGNVDIKWESTELNNAFTTIVFDINWHTGVVAGENFVFTVNKIMVAEEAQIVDVSAAVTGVRFYTMAMDGSSGSWANGMEYNANPFETTGFTTTATISDLPGGWGDHANQGVFRFIVYFSNGAIGKTYNFTFSDLEVLVGGANIFEGVNLATAYWGGEGSTITAGANGVYNVSMTVAGESTYFTIPLPNNPVTVSSIKMNVTLPAEFEAVSGEVTNVRFYTMAMDGSSGSWANGMEYNANPFETTGFTTTATIEDTPGGWGDHANQGVFRFVVSFSPEVIGKTYNFTFSDLEVLVGGANIFEGVNLATAYWGGEGSIITAGANGVYNVSMTVAGESTYFTIPLPNNPVTVSSIKINVNMPAAFAD